MLREAVNIENIYLIAGYTDLRYGIDGLVHLIEEKYKLSAFDKTTLFLFCGIKCDRIKALLWEEDGFLLLYKRIEKGRFVWPRNINEARNISRKQFESLLDGYAIESSIKKMRIKR